MPAAIIGVAAALREPGGLDLVQHQHQVTRTLSTTRTGSLLAAGDSSASALTSGFHLAFVIGAGLVVTAIGAAVAVLEPASDVEQEQQQERAEHLPEAEAVYSEAA